MQDLEFLKQAEEIEQHEESKEGWLDVDQVMEQLTNAAYEVLYEKHPHMKTVIEDIKKKNKEVYIYFFTDDEFYIIRPLKRIEYKEIIQQSQDPDVVAEHIFKKQLLYPTNLDLNELKAGVIPTMVNIILSVSNFNNQAPVVKL